jgi:hypothetical protein
MVQHGQNPNIADPTGEGLPMKSPIAALALFGTLAAGSAWAQSDSQDGTQSPGGASPSSAAIPNPANSPANPPGIGQVYSAASALPEPTPVSELKAASIPLPDEPIEPYLLSKDIGPFMVLAKVFRGPDSQRMALALVKELRGEYQLPAFILRTKDYPGKSMIRGVPPTARSEVLAADIGMPEKIRTFDEAAVLVGNEKTLADSEKLLHRVRKINPKCLDGMPKMFPWRTGLCYAIRTTNPYTPAQTLYPKTFDRLVVQMNGGLRSLAHCPGRYSLQVAEFTGRSAYQFGNQELLPHMLPNVRTSPLRTAAADAEKMADQLAKDRDVARLGQPIFVYHDRNGSRVFVGSFSSENDPGAAQLRDALMKLAVPLADRKRSRAALDTMIVPAIALTDVGQFKSKIQPSGG